MQSGDEAIRIQSQDEKLYEKEYIYLLKENVPGFEPLDYMLTLSGTSILYANEGETERSATFMWLTGFDDEHYVKERIHRNNSKEYKDTGYFIGGDDLDIDIHWWIDGEEFLFTYRTDSGIAPEDLIEYLEVKKIEVPK